MLLGKVVMPFLFLHAAMACNTNQLQSFPFMIYMYTYYTHHDVTAFMLQRNSYTVSRYILSTYVHVHASCAQFNFPLLIDQIYLPALNYIMRAVKSTQALSDNL